MQKNRIHFLANRTCSQMMSFIIETAGKIIVIDGGTAGDASHLLATLQKLTGAKVPHVDAWFFSHDHSDHVGALVQILRTQPDALTIGTAYYNFPSVQYLKRIEPGSAGEVDAFRAVQPMLWPITETITQGDSYTIGEATFDVLYTADPAKTRHGINESTAVLRMTLAGQTVLFLGDLGIEAGQKLLDMYGDDLKSDFVQMAHHGQNGVDKPVYEAIAPKGCFWCAPDWLWDNDAGRGYDTHVFKTVVTRGWMSEIGVKRHFVIKDGDHTIPLPYDFE